MRSARLPSMRDTVGYMNTTGGLENAVSAATRHVMFLVDGAAKLMENRSLQDWNERLNWRETPGGVTHSHSDYPT